MTKEALELKSDTPSLGPEGLHVEHQRTLLVPGATTAMVLAEVKVLRDEVADLHILIHKIIKWALVALTGLLTSSVLLSEDIPLEWDPYPSPTSITHIDAQCTQDILATPISWMTMNSIPIPPTDTTFIAQVSATGFWFCRVNAVSASGDSDTMKGIWKFISITSPGGARTP